MRHFMQYETLVDRSSKFYVQSYYILKCFYGQIININYRLVKRDEWTSGRHTYKHSCQHNRSCHPQFYVQHLRVLKSEINQNSTQWIHYLLAIHPPHCCTLFTISILCGSLERGPHNNHHKKEKLKITEYFDFKSGSSNELKFINSPQEA